MKTQRRSLRAEGESSEKQYKRKICKLVTDSSHDKSNNKKERLKIQSGNRQTSLRKLRKNKDLKILQRICKNPHI